MVTLIKRGSSARTIMEIFKKMKIHKGLNALKYSGILRLKENPSAIQKTMRDEWK